jgi:AcrR family transcriptional regulator
VTSTKDRILDSSAGLFRRQGYTGTGVKQIVTDADAPFGSLYHFFPGGKEQLAAEAIRRSGQTYVQMFAGIATVAPDVPSAVEAFFSGAADTLRETDYADACPIATVALEVASTCETLRRATAEVFESWILAAAAYFTAAGIDETRSRELAITMLSLLEGAFVFCRALRSTEPLMLAGRAAVEDVRASLPGS